MVFQDLLKKNPIIHFQKMSTFLSHRNFTKKRLKIYHTIARMYFIHKPTICLRYPLHAL